MSDASSFLGGARRKAAPPPQDPTPAPVPSPESADAAAPAEKDGQEPRGVTEVELPSGIQVYYQEGPKRLYRVRQLLQPDAEAANWVEVPSMSTVTKILDKPGLVHWGEKVGISLVQDLLRAGHVDLDFVLREEPALEDLRDPPWYAGEHLQEIGKQKELTNYYRKDAASKRGNSVHDALEGWAMGGVLPDPDVYAEHERGYVQGLRAFLEESKFVAEKSEVIVASVEHRVAGRFDLTGRIPEPVNLVYHLTEKNEKRKVFNPTSALVDLKTSKGVFGEYHLQTAGYKGCMVESGYEEPERGYILRVTKDGRYEFVDCAAEWLDFWWLRGLYDALQGIETRAHQNYRKELV
jgi:hypothetical protein